MTSVWACLVQKACGGVVQLTATKLLGLRSIAGVSRSAQAGRGRRGTTEGRKVHKAFKHRLRTLPTCIS